MISNAGSRRLPALRPLACGVMLALLTSPMSSLLARDLNDEDETIGAGDDVEEWMLTGQSNLTVNATGTFTIRAFGTSTVTLNNAEVTRTVGGRSAYAMEVRDNAVATATHSTFDTAIWALDDGRIELTGSSITVAEGAFVGDRTRSSWGLSLSNFDADSRPSVLLNGSTIAVAEQHLQSTVNPYYHSTGAVVRAGELTLRNNSRIEAANAGVLIEAQRILNHDVSLNLEASHIVSGRGPGIAFMADNDAPITANVLIADGSTIQAGDGNLLHVRAVRNPTAGENRINFTVDNSDLAGNIYYETQNMQGSVNVALRNNAGLTGRFFNVTTAGIHSGSTWTLTGDSNVGTLTLGGAGTVALSDGNSFNTLTVGDFNGEGGTLAFRSALEGDNALTDTLMITGDASGHANVTVTNAGGQGAQTEQGIELIRIDGQPNASFLLQGRATGGLYEYFLFRNPNGNWYLRSQVPTCQENPEEAGCIPTLPVEPTDPVDPIDPIDPVDPIDPGDPGDPGDPVDPENPVDPPEPDNPVLPVDPPTPERPMPVLRPETGAYLANQAAVSQLLQYSAQDRSTVATGDGVQTWANISNSESRMDAAGMQRLRTQQSRLQVGAELGAFDGGQGRIGALLSAGRAETTSRSTVTGYRASGKVEGGAAGVYASWSNDALTVGASVQHGRFSNQVQGEGVAQERYDTRAWQTSIEAGYRFDAGSIGGLQLSLQPQLQLTHTAVSMDTHVESNGTVIADAGGNGLSTRVGLRLEGQAATGSGRFIPYLALDAHHAAKDVAVSFDGEVLEGGMPRRRVDLQLGGQLVLGGGLSAWGGIGASHGTDNYRDTSARVGVSYQW